MITNTKTQKVLLPTHIVPTHYDIFLQPDLENFVFQGEEEISVTVLKATKTIVLHSAEIEIFSVTYHAKREFAVTNIVFHEENETVTLKFKEMLPVGKGSVKIKFSGILNNKMRGFYRSRYTHKGKEYHMGVTQFESTDARRAFPCFDEPALKATFSVSLRVPSDRTVISNTLEEKVEEQEGGYKIVSFEKSPVMSSYLLAFIIGHFEYIEKRTPEGVLVRVYVTPGKKKQAVFALDVAAKLMSFYNEYFGIAYPLPTMDLIAIPDFANGAMENWGAVTYRETALLVDEETTSLHARQWVALVIAHELAHQWFGNLVTMQWWTHLWLNEGFASFMEYLAVDKLFPDWHIWTQFVYTEQAKALSLDGMKNTHAIEIPVHHPGEISEIFDAVSYSKGASVIRMIESYVGEDNFQKGLQLYLKKHKYSNAETKDLWDALEQVSKQPVGKIMKNWTSKPGYPLVSVDQKRDSIELSQERFYSSKAEGEESAQWMIPMSLISDSNNKPQKVLINKSSVLVPGFSTASWIKANVDESSFVRVKYTANNLELLEDPIRLMDERLSEQGRFSLVRDVFALIESGHVTTSEALRFVTAYKGENSYIVWAEIITHLLEIKSLLYNHPIHDKYCKFARELLIEISEKVGWVKSNGESHSQTLLRSTVFYALGTFGDKKTIANARALFALAREGKKVDSDLRGLSYALTAENGSKKEFDIFMDIYQKAESEEEKDRALRAMSSFKNEALLQSVLTLAFSSNVRAQDSFKAVYLVASNPAAIDLVWDYVKENWSEIVERFAGGHLFSRFVGPFAKFNSQEKAKEVSSFFKKNNVPGIERTVAQTVEKIRGNADVVKRDLKKIELFLKA